MGGDKFLSLRAAHFVTFCSSAPGNRQPRATVSSLPSSVPSPPFPRIPHFFARNSLGRRKWKLFLTGWSPSDAIALAMSAESHSFAPCPSLRKKLSLSCASTVAHHAPTGMTPTGHGGQVTGHAGLQRHFPRFRRGEWHCRNLRSGEEHSRMRCGENVRLYKTWHLKHTNKEH